MTQEAERGNGGDAMLVFVAAIGAHATTGKHIPGIAHMRKAIGKEKLVVSLRCNTR